jgi:DNA-binding transcriptional LysR family regulator
MRTSPRLSLDALQVLDAIARKGSFAAAAEELHRVPSAVTYTVQQLEQDLDVLLFDRSKHRASLTPAGHELLTEGRHLLRAASDLECRIQQVARGWETELRIALDTILNTDALLPLVAEFYASHAPRGGARDNDGSSTRIRISEEVLGGNWDALLAGRADLVIGASGDMPAGGGFATLPLASIPFVFVAAPNHPIVKAPLPLSEASILQHRSVSVADTSRNLPPRTTGLITGQDVFTVPTMRAKVAAHIAGLGVGYLPKFIADAEAKHKRLRILPTAVEKPHAELCIVWRANRTGKALRWFAKRLGEKEVVEALLQVR